MQKLKSNRSTLYQGIQGVSTLLSPSLSSMKLKIITLIELVTFLYNLFPSLYMFEFDLAYHSLNFPKYLVVSQTIQVLAEILTFRDYRV